MKLSGKLLTRGKNFGKISVKGVIYMKKKRFFCALLLFSLIFSLISCGAPNSQSTQITPKKRSFYDYFDTVGTFYDYNNSTEADFERLADRVEAVLSEYHKLYDIYREYDGITNLATLNKTAGTGPIKVDRKIIDLLLFSKEMYGTTDGRVNVAFGAVLSIWHDYRTAGIELPPTDLLSSAEEHTDINSVIIDEENLTVEILDHELSLDVGAVGKGFAVEAVAKMLEDEGRGGYVLDVGGNLRAIGKKPNGSGWSAGIINPDRASSQTYVYTMTVSDCALVTSGTYERFYTVGGINYHHIINPETLMPTEYYLSVSVKSGSSATSDALSTAIFNMKYDEVLSFVKAHPDLFVVLVMPSGEVRTLGRQ